MKNFLLGFLAAVTLTLASGAVAAGTGGRVYKIFLNDYAEAPTAGVDCSVMHSPRISSYRRVLQGRYALWCGPRRYKTPSGDWYPENPVAIYMTDVGLIAYGGRSGTKLLYRTSWR
jgi:hypothetical protein